MLPQHHVFTKGEIAFSFMIQIHSRPFPQREIQDLKKSPDVRVTHIFVTAPIPLDLENTVEKWRIKLMQGCWGVFLCYANVFSLIRILVLAPHRHVKLTYTILKGSQQVESEQAAWDY